jgi:dihydrofolate reductase
MKAIAAQNKLAYIGLNGTLPWKCKADFKHFKSLTSGGICIIGKRTFVEDLKMKPLPNRIMIVVGSSMPAGYASDMSVHWFTNMFDAVKNAIVLSQLLNKEIWVIGGATIYNQLWPLITDLYLSTINDHTVGDVTLKVPDDFKGRVHNFEFEPDQITQQ